MRKRNKIATVPGEYLVAQIEYALYQGRRPMVAQIEAVAFMHAKWGENGERQRPRHGMSLHFNYQRALRELRKRNA
jgi:hypothetical protein